MKTEAQFCGQLVLWYHKRFVVSLTIGFWWKMSFFNFIFLTIMITGLGFGFGDTGLGLGLEHAVLEPIPARLLSCSISITGKRLWTWVIRTRNYDNTRDTDDTDADVDAITDSEDRMMTRENVSCVTFLRGYRRTLCVTCTVYEIDLTCTDNLTENWQTIRNGNRTQPAQQALLSISRDRDHYTTRRACVCVSEIIRLHFH